METKEFPDFAELLRGDAHVEDGWFVFGCGCRVRPNTPISSDEERTTVVAPIEVTACRDEHVDVVNILVTVCIAAIAEDAGFQLDSAICVGIDEAPFPGPIMSA